MSDQPTPRTDGFRWHDDGDTEVIAIEFARQLERELAAAQAEIANISELHAESQREIDRQAERIGVLEYALRELVEVEGAPPCLTSDEVRASNARSDAAWDVARAALADSSRSGDAVPGTDAKPAEVE